MLPTPLVSEKKNVRFQNAMQTKSSFSANRIVIGHVTLKNQFVTTIAQPLVTVRRDSSRNQMKTMLNVLQKRNASSLSTSNVAKTRNWSNVWTSASPFARRFV